MRLYERFDGGDLVTHKRAFKMLIMIEHRHQLKTIKKHIYTDNLQLLAGQMVVQNGCDQAPTRRSNSQSTSQATNFA